MVRPRGAGRNADRFVKDFSKGDSRIKSERSERLAEKANPKLRLPAMWLCHADARQVSDLPKTTHKIWRSMTGSETLKERRVRRRRVRDLPRIGVAKPLGW